MMRALPLTLGLSGLAVTCAACGGEVKRLEGSLTEVVDLSFRKADVLQTESELSLRFVQPQGAGENVVLRVTASLFGTAVDAKEPLDLAEPDAVGNQRGRVTRNVVDDPLTTFPALQRGSLTFDRSLISGETVRGELHLTFEQGTELASGRTVFGTFEAKVE